VERKQRWGNEPKNYETNNCCPSFYTQAETPTECLVVVGVVHVVVEKQTPLVIGGGRMHVKLHCNGIGRWEEKEEEGSTKLKDPRLA
jgi:hypothetical protein